MRKPLLRVLFSTSSPAASTNSISRPINLIISDLFILPPIWEGHKRNIVTYLFVPNNLKAYLAYMDASVERVNSNEAGLDCDRLLHKTISLTKGLICNSMRDLDKKLLKELRRQTAVPGSDKPVHFVAPLISEDFNQKQNVSLI